ncbi:TPA: hypothetical protein N2F43_002171 [Salmonella enterica]|nr:hypothetical protein [Salmonella enterica]
MNNKLTDETLKAWKTEAIISLGETPKDCRDYSHHEAILALVTELQELRRTLSGLPQDAIDGGWTAAGISAYVSRLESELQERGTADEVNKS